MEHRVPQYLHRPVQMLWWEQDEIVSILVGYLLGFFLGGWWYLAMIGVPYAYIRLRRRMPRGFLVHIQFMLGLMTYKGYPHFFIREYRE